LSTLHVIDWIVIIGYFGVILGLAWWVIKQKSKNPEDYFLAGRNLGWFVVGTSIFASNIGSEHLVGLAGSGATDGVAMAHYELHAWCLLVLGWVMAPFYMRSKVFTMPEFLEKRFSPASRTVLSLISLIAYVLTKIAVGIFAGGIVFGVLLPDVNFLGLDSFWLGSILVIILTGFYTIVGGLKAVAYTESLQTIVLIFGSLLVTYFGLEALGGWDAFKASLDSEMFNLWKPLVPVGIESTWAPVKDAGKMAWYFNDNYPWLGMLFAAPIIGLWYWTTDQYIVQRVLGAPDQTQARRGTIAAAFLKLLPVFIFIIPGMIAFAIAQQGLDPHIASQLIGPDGEVIRANAQKAFPLLVIQILPVGVRGIVVAGLLAALMSSLAGVFNASATLFTMDFYQRIRPDVSQERLVWIGRVATVVMVIIGLLWIPVIQGGRGLYDYLQGVQAYLAPPIFVVFFFGVFFKRLNAKGSLAAMLTGFALGIIRLAVDTPVKMIEGFTYDQGSFLWIINNIFFQYYGLLIFIISAIVMFAVSYATEEPDYEKIDGLAFGLVSDKDKKETRDSWTAVDVINSSVVIVLILTAYLYFTG
jgi:SSS family solute:Na+ symporter